MYVNDLNPKKLIRTIKNFKKIEMKDLRKTKFYLGLQIEHFPTKVLVHQSTYNKKVLKHFYMDEAHILSSPMVVCSLYVKKKDSFRHCEKGKELLGHEVPDLSVIGTLMYLVNCTHPDIAFPINLLVMYNSSPTQRHWNCIKHILRYLQGTTDMSLFYLKESKQRTIAYIC